MQEEAEERQETAGSDGFREVFTGFGPCFDGSEVEQSRDGLSQLELSAAGDRPRFMGEEKRRAAVPTEFWSCCS